MKIKFFLSTQIVFCIVSSAISQDAVPAFTPKGQLYGYWGYNRSWYSKSDITFVSDFANFTLYDVKATDRPSSLSTHNYIFQPTIPQFNVRLGFAVKNNFTVSFGYDHLKYVMVRNQTVKISGEIQSTTETMPYAGTYNNNDIVVSPDFLRYEHTNGLNYFSADAEYYCRLWRSKSGLLDVAFTPGVSLGFLYPRSDIDIFNVEGVNIFHVAGWGTSVTAGVKFNIGKYFFIQWSNRGGYMMMPDVLCRENNFTAKQNFWFFATAGFIGGQFVIPCKKKSEK